MTATNIVNDGNTITNVVESTLTGSTGSNIVIKNDGTVTVSEYVSSVLKTLLQITPGTGVNIGAASRQVEIIGNMQIDGSLIVSSITFTIAISCATITVTGTVTGTKINVTTGSLSRISTGNVSVPTITGTTVTHNLGTTPDIVILCNGTNPGQIYVGYNAYSYTSTQFTIYQYNSAAATYTFYWVAIKF